MRDFYFTISFFSNKSRKSHIQKLTFKMHEMRIFVGAIFQSLPGHAPGAP